MYADKENNTVYNPKERTKHKNTPTLISDTLIKLLQIEI